MASALIMPSRFLPDWAANGIHGQLIFYRRRIRHTAIEGSHVFVVLVAAAVFEFYRIVELLLK